MQIGLQTLALTILLRGWTLKTNVTNYNVAFEIKNKNLKRKGCFTNV